MIHCRTIDQNHILTSHFKTYKLMIIVIMFILLRSFFKKGFTLIIINISRRKSDTDVYYACHQKVLAFTYEREIDANREDCHLYQWDQNLCNLWSSRLI